MAWLILAGESHVVLIDLSVFHAAQLDSILGTIVLDSIDHIEAVKAIDVLFEPSVEVRHLIELQR
jgi:hypothetical protein